MSELRENPRATPEQRGTMLAHEYREYVGRCQRHGIRQLLTLESSSSSQRQLEDDFFRESRNDEILWGEFQKISWKKVWEILSGGVDSDG
jgi:hypothetical protein